VDRCAWFEPGAARAKLNPAQAELIGRLEVTLRS
jgi:predicted NUDIX family NTP pyrophosphohydrolase